MLEFFIGLLLGALLILMLCHYDKKSIHWDGQKYGYRMGVEQSKCVVASFYAHEDKITADCYMPIMMNRKHID